MIIKGLAVGLALTFCALIWRPQISLLLVFGTVLVAVLKSFVNLVRQSAKDFDDARTPFGTISAFFGWTHARKVGNGERPMNIGFLEGMAGGAILGFITATIAHNLISQERF